MDEENNNPLDGSVEEHSRDSESANLDALIDNALRTYSAGEPRHDLPARILSAAHALEPSPRSELRRLTPPWAFAAVGWLATAAMLLVWINARNLQIVIQPRSATTQLALSAPPTFQGFPTPASTSLKTAAEQPAPRITHYQHAIRATVPTPHGRTPDRDSVFHPIAFAPIVIAPISSGDN